MQAYGKPIAFTLLLVLAYLWAPTGVTFGAVWTTLQLCLCLTFLTAAVIVPVFDTSMLTNAASIVAAVATLGVNVFDAFYVPYNNWKTMNRFQLRENQTEDELGDDELSNFKAN